jgi:Fe-S cluster biogenesis protein NfuA
MVQLWYKARENKDLKHEKKETDFMSEAVEVSLEFTPNPNTLKFVVNQALLEKGAANYINKEAASNSPLARKLFDVTGVAGVMIGQNFITITKGEAGDWEEIHRLSRDMIADHLSHGGKAVEGDVSSSPANHSAATGEIETLIKKVLDEEIRPAVAMDGGDITFDKYEDGVVYLFLQGSCSGCPSSTMTLKMGIESRLKELIPGIKEVVSI